MSRQKKAISSGTPICVWFLSDLDEAIYQSGCGRDFQFTEDGPLENNFRFCPYCGVRLKVGR